MGMQYLPHIYIYLYISISISISISIYLSIYLSIYIYIYIYIIYIYEGLLRRYDYDGIWLCCGEASSIAIKRGDKQSDFLRR